MLWEYRRGAASPAPRKTNTHPPRYPRACCMAAPHLSRSRHLLPREKSTLALRDGAWGNTVELAGKSWPVAISHSLPPCGGGLGWGAVRYETGSAGVAKVRQPPTLALPHKGGGDYKYVCTIGLLLIQRYWGMVVVKTCSRIPRSAVMPPLICRVRDIFSPGRIVRLRCETGHGGREDMLVHSLLRCMAAPHRSRSRRSADVALGDARSGDESRGRHTQL